ncbi:phosphonate C-P lyase system protein PhnH [Hyphomonas atlantica corrig.]|uniref:phosphonate C-P lyase system protein PhnH n=1 Tax=Hyphomonas atlantica TaxID=1280948 RepID=UPI0023551011|nr:phosphonate C-P lyase system protein PhnH [Hyphomonas atlantica]
MTQTLDLSAVQSGFADPVLDAQACFRKVLDALSRPGKMAALDVLSAPEPLNLASAGLALTLMDFDTPIYLSPSLNTGAIVSWLRFHCSAPITAVPKEASFAFLQEGDAWPALDEFHQGDAKYPDTSTSLVIQLPSLDTGQAVTLEGPGIETSETIHPVGLSESFWAERTENVADFQLGIDCYFTAENKVLGLPRTTRTTLV